MPDKDTRFLLPHHQQLLDDSAISPRVAKARGYRTVTTPSELIAVGYASYQAANVPGLLIPIRDVFGENTYFHYRPDTPRIKDGKPLKYEAPAGAQPVLDVPARVQKVLRTPDVPLFVTEGSRKVDAGLSKKLFCIGLGGVWLWRDRRGLLPDWEAIALRDRDIYFVFDSDVMTKGEVRQALDRISALVKRKGAHVRYILLPGGPHGEKVGLDDFFATGKSVDDLLARIVSQLPGEEASVCPTEFGGVLISDVVTERVDWIWKQRLAHKKLTVLDGDPGLGKSTAVLDIAARISTGSPFPRDTQEREPQGVVILSAEDGLSDTIRPRLEVAGADLSRIFAMTHVGDEDRPVTVSIPDSLSGVEAAITTMNASLLIIDPLMAYFSPSINAHNDQQVRTALRPLAAMLERTGASCIMVRHLNKSDSRTALYRGGGSIGIIGAARFGMVVARDPDNPFARVIAATKCNLGLEPASLRYELVGVTGTDVAQVVWSESDAPYSATDLLNHEDESDDDETGEATAWLKAILEKNSITAEYGKREGRKAGYSDRDLRRAKKALGVIAKPNLFGGEWSWYLPGFPETPSE